MPTKNIYHHDIEEIISLRHDQGADYWTTPDSRLLKGSPFSAYDCAHMLMDLGVPPSDTILSAVAEMFLDTWRPDGRFKIYPKGGILPCHTAYVLSLLCRMGYQADERLQKSFLYFLDTPYTDGGWRCNKFSYGRGPETEYSNPLPTLNVLDAFRFSQYLNNELALDRAVEFLLQHWVIRKPIGPCQYGIGSRFMRIEYPMMGYNLLNYVYVLSFYDKAKDDKRFLEALKALQDKLVDNQLVLEHVSPKLSKLTYCKKGQPCEIITARYHEIISNLHL
ncbi:MAG: prenyltransferase [Defluviitaleaceae bacterium]|nr:prenyltransferase [Defluviitaleaceae bacterium]